MALFTVPLAGGGSMVVNASDSAAATENVKAQGGTPSEWGGPIAGGGPVWPGSSTSTSSNTSTSNSSASGAQYAAAIQQATNALAAGNREAFQRAILEADRAFQLDKDKFAQDVSQFNQTFGLTQSAVTGTYQGSQTQSAEMQAANIAAQQAGLTGSYQAPMGTGNIALDAFNSKAGLPTQQTYLQATGGDRNAAAARYWSDVQGAILQAGVTPQQFVYGSGQGTPTLPALTSYANQFGTWGVPQQGATTLAAQQQQYAQQMGMIAQAATLQANPFRQQQAIGQMGNLLGGQGVAGFSAPNTVQGVGTAGGNTQGGMGYLSQMIDDIRDPSANQHSMQDVLNGIPTPAKLNSTEFLRAAPSTQSMVLQGMQEKYGLDPNDALAQIKNTLPQFNAPTTMGTVRR